MSYALIALIVGLVTLVWSADRFIDGAAAVARNFGVSPLLIGMIIVGFGTSAPEMLVSSIAAWQHCTGIALGNAYGSNTTNIALILGISVLIRPLVVHPRTMKRELPVLFLVTLLGAWQLRDGLIDRRDALFLLLPFCILLLWALRAERRRAAGAPTATPPTTPPTSNRKAIFWLICGLALLIASSRLLVWGAVHMAKYFGISDLIIGLTIIALGTSLPELASAIAAARRGEHDLVLGNIIGSNIFNTLVVVGLAALVRPLAAEPLVLQRDVLIMGGLTLLLYLFCRGLRQRGQIRRLEGIFLLLSYVAYIALLIYQTLTPSS